MGNEVSIVPEKRKSLLDDLVAGIDNDPAFRRVVNPPSTPASSGRAQKRVPRKRGQGLVLGSARFKYTGAAEDLLKSIENGIRAYEFGGGVCLFPHIECWRVPKVIPSENREYFSGDTALMMIAYAARGDQEQVMALWRGIRGKIGEVSFDPGKKIVKSKIGGGECMLWSNAVMSIAYAAMDAPGDSTQMLAGIVGSMARSEQGLFENWEGSKAYGLLGNALLAARFGVYVDTDNNAGKLVDAIERVFPVTDGIFMQPKKSSVDMLGSLAMCLAYRIMGREDKAQWTWQNVNCLIEQKPFTTVDEREYSLCYWGSGRASTLLNALYLLNLLAARE